MAVKGGKRQAGKPKQILFSSGHSLLRDQIRFNGREKNPRRGKQKKKRQGEPKPETNTKKQRAKQTRASPSQPTKQQQQQAGARATPPREQPARPPVSSEGNSSSAGPRPAPARQPQLLPSRRSAQFLLFLGFDSVPPGASSPSPEIQQVRARRSSARPGIMPPLL